MSRDISTLHSLILGHCDQVCSL